MAKAKLPMRGSPFPPITLSPCDAQRLEAAAEAVVKHTVQQYHEHLTVHNGVVDDKRWKKIKQSEDLRVYVERSHTSSYSHIRDAADSASASASSADSSERASLTTDDDSDAFRAVSSMLTVGSVDGSLEDVLYGALSPTTEAMCLKSAYVGDGFCDWGVLARIIEPSASSPFRDLSVKWAVKRHPALVGVVMRLRDVVFIESVGLAMTPSGERIGYHLRHSVDLSACRELVDVGIVRAKLSFCYVYRQRCVNSVEVFVRGTISPMGDAPARLMAVTTAEVSASIWKKLHHAEMKKLARVLRTVRLAGAVQLSGNDGAAASSRTANNLNSSRSTPATCALCTIRVSDDTSATKFALSRTGGSANDSHCHVCAARVCARCRVVQTLFVPVGDDDPSAFALAKTVVDVSVTCCTRCVHRIASASSAQFAALDALALQGKSVDYVAALESAVGA